ncbi:MAG: YicC family protein [Prevotellaceae bacterium]|jgi:uncharacterized protein (TIGR00255 family)|nr:YicC family protein [Prevotellaceae bacterium]
MSLSMTGYGKAELSYEGRKITTELRSVNGKQLDLCIKLPSQYRELESDIRALLLPLQRGKVDVFINVENLQSRPAACINEALFKEYQRQLENLCDEVSADAILRLPDVIAVAKSKLPDEERKLVLGSVAQAFVQLSNFRRQEGKAIMEDILSRVTEIGRLLTQVEPFERNRIEVVKTRLTQALNDAVGAANVDKNRFEQELIYYLEKLDITEEKTRLRNHCEYFFQTAKDDDAGRKLGFIAQEIGREINTLGSKANNSDMQRIVVNMKDELEKIKEQLLNVL